MKKKSLEENEPHTHKKRFYKDKTFHFIISSGESVL